MKKYLLPNEVNWYRANMHCHTTVSDGHYSPAEIKEAYKNICKIKLPFFISPSSFRSLFPV